MEDLKEQLRQFLNEKDMRLFQAAKLLKCSVGTLSKFLNDKTNPNPRIEYRIKKLIEGK